ncbi:NAD(P)-dependent oxidoreductase [Actinomadura fulvescens]|uniref:D-3-phosphoglycerate dehydrogenase SerA n=1 Tax=Actinomadura fulvescens TaxID=46160 RepID=A0ABP6C2E8_9ACTN
MAERTGRALVLAPMRGPGWDQLNELTDVVYEPAGVRRGPAELARGLAELGATILVAGEDDEVAGPVLDHPLELVAVTGDPGNVDVETATARGIPVLCTAGHDADAVAELTVALLFAVVRGVVTADRAVREGRAAGEGPGVVEGSAGRRPAWQLAGRTFGIVGLGAVGRAVWWRMDGLGMRVIACDPYAEGATHKLPELLNVADVVSLHATLTEESRGMIGARQFEIMKDGAVFLNTARAGLHDTGALVGALASGHLTGAGLDLAVEPTHPLAGLPNVVLTPHIGAETADAEADRALAVAEDLGRLRRGEPLLHCLNPGISGRAH